MMFFDIKVRNVEVLCVSGPSLLVKGVFLCVLKLVVCLVCQLKPILSLGRLGAIYDAEECRICRCCSKMP
jgi:hypothetical protein